MITYQQGLEIEVSVTAQMVRDGVRFMDSVLVGSSFTNGEGNDADVVILVADSDADKSIEYFMNAGYEVGGNLEYGGDFVSLKNGATNVLLVWDILVFDKWKISAYVCKYVNGILPIQTSITRDQRVEIHKIIMDGNVPAL